MSALDDVVVQDVSESLWCDLSVQSVLPVHESGECTHVGHLSADDSCLDLCAAEVLLEFIYSDLLSFIDEACALIIEDILIVERFDLFMLRVAAGWIARAEQLDRPDSGWGLAG